MLTLGPNSELGTVMAAAARTMQQMAPSDLLQSVVDVAADSVPGFDMASISMLERDRPGTTKASTDEVARQLDVLQYDLGEGPCIDAMKEPGLVVVPSMRDEQRWPEYVAEATAHGILAQLSIMVYLDDQGRTLGGLNIYSTTTEGVTDEARAMAELFATQAAIALGASRRQVDLGTGLASRQLIGQAIGLVMERYQLDEDLAFQFLVRVSTTTNTKIREVARKLVDQANAGPDLPRRG